MANTHVYPLFIQLCWNWVSHSLCLTLSIFLSVIFSINAFVILCSDSSGSQSNGLTPLYATGRSLKQGNMTVLYLTSESSYPKKPKSPHKVLKLHCGGNSIGSLREKKDTAVLLQNESRRQGSSAPGQMPELWADREIHDAPSTEEWKQRKHEKSENMVCCVKNKELYATSVIHFHTIVTQPTACLHPLWLFWENLTWDNSCCSMCSHLLLSLSFNISSAIFLLVW